MDVRSSLRNHCVALPGFFDPEFDPQNKDVNITTRAIAAVLNEYQSIQGFTCLSLFHLVAYCLLVREKTPTWLDRKSSADTGNISGLYTRDDHASDANIDVICRHLVSTGRTPLRCYSAELCDTGLKAPDSYFYGGGAQTKTPDTLLEFTFTAENLKLVFPKSQHAPFLHNTVPLVEWPVDYTERPWILAKILHEPVSYVLCQQRFLGDSPSKRMCADNPLGHEGRDGVAWLVRKPDKTLSHVFFLPAVSYVAARLDYANRRCTRAQQTIRGFKYPIAVDALEDQPLRLIEAPPVVLVPIFRESDPGVYVLDRPNVLFACSWWLQFKAYFHYVWHSKFIPCFRNVKIMDFLTMPDPSCVLTGLHFATEPFLLAMAVGWLGFA